MLRSSVRFLGVVSMLSASVAWGQGAPEAPKPDSPKPDFPPFEQVAKDYEKVVSTADGASSLYTLYFNKKKNQLLAELNPNFAQQKVFIATSIAGGSPQTGWQWQDLYCYWKQNDDQLMLMEPNLQRQARGGNQDAELRSAVQRTYSDRLITSVKVLTHGPNRGPVIDLDELLVKRSNLFTGRAGNAELATFGKVRAFPENVEIPVTIPMGNGELTTIHYSISVIPKTEYKPREADERIGYFLTVFKDFTKNEAGGNQFTRYINRWNLQKRDPSLALSPPTEPIVFYIEHTVPVRYRRWVRDGILEWNKAFEKVGVLGAVEVRQQDAQTGAFMDINPEDVRYNFFRWISSERAFAMGPSRVNPETGEILDADIIFDDAMLKNYALQYQAMVAAYGLNGATPAAIEFMEERPLWNPLTRYEEKHPVRDEIMNDPELSPEQKADLLGEPAPTPSQRLMSRVVQQNLECSCGQGMAMQMCTAHLALQLMADQLVSADAPVIDGVPEEYLGTILKYITSHEVGHTLGLRHNFKASSWLSVDEYTDRRGVPNVGSVMDYVPIYVPPTPEGKRGDWMPTTIGPYDYWAIEYGYTFDDAKRAELLKRVAERELQFATDEDAMGPDPLVARWDLGADPLDWSIARLALVKTLRDNLLDKSVKDGEAWHLLRRAYEQLLGEHLNALSTASRYIGGVHVNRDRKGDPDGRDPLQPVDPAKQRKALAFIIDNAFNDAAFDLRPEVLSKLASDKNRHWGNFGSMDEAFSISNRVAQIQAFAMFFLMNGDTLGRVYDNEIRTPDDADALTLPELINAVTSAAYSELDTKLNGQSFTNRKPMISELRRSLQTELTARLVDLALRPGRLPQPVPTLAKDQLRQLDMKLAKLLEKLPSGQVDDYSRVHLTDLKARVDKALNAIKVEQF
jgi:hypothetical protein